MNQIDRIVLPWYTEGPVVDKQGNLYFTTLSDGHIMCMMKQSGDVVKWAKGIKPNGQIILDNGEHLVCDSGDASVKRYDENGQYKGYLIKDTCAGKQIHVPNDLVADGNDGVYFTDSIREHGKVCYVGPDGKQSILAEKLDFPNGIALSPDGKMLFVAESYQNRIIYFPLVEPGVTVGKWDLFSELPKNKNSTGYNLPDGIKLDKEGALWVAHYGMQAVQKLNKDGNLIKTIMVDFPLPSNLCFTNHQLIITGGQGEPGPGGVRLLDLKDL